MVVKEHDGLIDLVLILCSSPWTNKYDPSLPDGALPSAQLRQLEVQANEVFDIYRDLYAPPPSRRGIISIRLNLFEYDGMPTIH